MHQSPAETLALQQELPSQALAASTAFNGDGSDMQGWDGILFILNLGVTDGTVDMKVQGDDNSSFSSATDITGAASTQIAATGDNKLYCIDVYRPTERYIRAVVTTGAGAVADEAGVISIRYRGTGRRPVTQHADVAELIKVKVN
jgi:hypothetical protein